MQLKVEFSVKAAKSFDKIITYIEAKWNHAVVEKFLLKFDKSVTAIVSNPESFPNSDFINVRKCVITKQTTLL
ncbi:type II toxin-antitoxin system RelE/ParE family toxin [uncultured Flavobacterium sp.]|uniref:type II toxin-antitoxin system RelE/ParE family toxin n=1 Tax=uncultured Flavobacterium sp. TaxID=165435 RepID=UPI0025F6D99F|nr:type II toxin-antitoxin system RelE/ParE family toxin [uncultured Flavobacterium sp.]